MTSRYNPHRIEKQARQWPALSFAETLEEDLKIRSQILWENQENTWLDPFRVDTGFPREIQAEYGVDACRIACLAAHGTVNPQTLLESSFKWLAKLNTLFTAIPRADFIASIWLQAALQGHDHINLRNLPYSALALIRHALSHSPPNKNLSPLQKNFVISAVSPFCPLWARFNLPPQQNLPSTFPTLLKEFPEYVCIKLSLPTGGHSWQVFLSERYAADPISEIRSLKWINKAAGTRKIRLENLADGVKLCFH